MSPRQLIAIQNPTLFAFETLNPLFCRGIRGNSSILTVNSGYE